MQNHLNPVAGVGAVVFYNDAVLLVERKFPPFENQWCIPGGKVLLGETLQQAAEREILEETGVTIYAGEPVYSFDVIDKDNDNKIKYHYIVIDLIAEYVSGKPVGRDDAILADWVDREKFYKLDINKTTKDLLASRFQFP